MKAGEIVIRGARSKKGYEWNRDDRGTKRKGGSLKKRNRYDWSRKKKKRKKGRKERRKQNQSVWSNEGRRADEQQGGRVDGSRSLESAEHLAWCPVREEGRPLLDYGGSATFRHVILQQHKGYRVTGHHWPPFALSFTPQGPPLPSFVRWTICSLERVYEFLTVSPSILGYRGQPLNSYSRRIFRDSPKMWTVNAFKWSRSWKSLLRNISSIESLCSQTKLGFLFDV